MSGGSSGDGNQAFNDYYGIDNTINANTSQKENVENDGDSDTTDVENNGKEVDQSSSSAACEKSTDDDDDNNNPKVSMSPPKDRAASEDNDDDDDESDIELLDPETYRAEQQQQQQKEVAPAAAAASTNNDNSDEELEVVGTHNEQKLPHLRIHCLDFRYKENNATTTTSSTNDNAKFCSLCYCYVCDKPALECENWFMGEKGICSDVSNDDDGGGKAKSNDTESNTATNATAPHNNHCNATDKGGQKHLWKNMRTAIKDGKDPSNVSSSYQASDDEGNYGGFSHPSLQQFMANYMGAGGGGAARYRNHATSRGGARQRRSHDGSTSATSATNSTYGSTTYSAAASRSRSAPPRRRRQNQSGSSGSNKRPAPHDHRARIRTQQMLEDLYG